MSATTICETHSIEEVIVLAVVVAMLIAALIAAAVWAERDDQRAKAAREHTNADGGER